MPAEAKFVVALALSVGVVGPMLFLGVGGCIGFAWPKFPYWVKIPLQVVVGTFAGARIGRETVADMRGIGRPILFTTAWMVSSALMIGYLADLLTEVGLATALLGCNPGGLVEMSAMAVSVEADVPTVAILQSFRLVVTMVLVPLLARRNQAVTMPSSGSPVVVSSSDLSLGSLTPCVPSRRFPWAFTLVLGAVGAVFFVTLGVPAGPVVGSLLLVALVSAATGRVSRIPQGLRTAAQIGIGALIGASFTPQTALLLRGSWVAVVLATAATMGSGLILAHFMRSWLRSDARTALLACAPAGVTQMALIADELGADVLGDRLPTYATHVLGCCSSDYLPVVALIDV